MNCTKKDSRQKGLAQKMNQINIEQNQKVTPIYLCPSAASARNKSQREIRSPRETSRVKSAHRELFLHVAGCMTPPLLHHFFGRSFKQ